ncbi:MAG: hypothetical protein ABL996_14630 [Micropepsaceae bacterium]
MTLTKYAATGIAAALIMAPAAYAKGQSWWLDLEGGIEVDDNVAVNQNIDENGDKIDASSGSSDFAATFEVDAGYKVIDTDDSRIEIGYNFFQSLYQDLNEFNYTEHTPSLNAWTKVGGVKLGITYTYLNASLDNDFFLEEHIFSPSITAYVTEQIYVSAFYRYLDKNYNHLDGRRDARTQQPGGDVFYYWDKANRGYVSAGASYTIEDTDITPVDYPSYGYDGVSLRGAVQLPFDAFERKSRLRLAYAFQQRDYDELTSTPPPVGARREDERHTVRLKLEVDVMGNMKAIGEYRFIDRNSNLVTADYQENIASAALRFSF